MNTLGTGTTVLAHLKRNEQRHYLSGLQSARSDRCDVLVQIVSRVESYVLQVLVVFEHVRCLVSYMGDFILQREGAGAGCIIAYISMLIACFYTPMVCAAIARSKRALLYCPAQPVLELPLLQMKRELPVMKTAQHFAQGRKTCPNCPTVHSTMCIRRFC